MFLFALHGENDAVVASHTHLCPDVDWRRVGADSLPVVAVDAHTSGGIAADCFGHRRCSAYQGIHVAETVAVPARLRLAFYQRLEGDERQHGAYGCGSQLRLDAETDKRRGESQCASAHKAECSESVCK